MANVTFDGANKLIICNSGTTTLSVQDTYSYWKEWVLLSDNSKYLQAMSIVGGDPTVGGKYLGTTYFLENGWKIRPQSADHVLTVEGNLYARTGSPFVPCTGSYNVQVVMTVSNLVDTVATGGSEAPTVAQIVEGVYNAQVSNFSASGSFGELLGELHEETFGRWVVDPENNTMTLYKANGNVLKTFDLTRATGEVAAYVERVPQ